MVLNRLMQGGPGPAYPGATISRKERAEYNSSVYGEARTIDAYYYATPLRPIAAGGTDFFGIPVQADAEFVCEWLSGIIAESVAGVIEWRLDATGAGGLVATDGITNVVATIRITDTGSDRQMMNEQVYWHTVIGTAQRPNYLAAPKHFMPNALIQIDVTNLTALAGFWQVVLGGVKIYRKGKV